MSYMGQKPTIGAFYSIDDISGSFNGITTDFTVTVDGGQTRHLGQVENLTIVINSVIQKPGTSFTINEDVLSFSTAPESGDTFWGTVIGNVYSSAGGDYSNAQIDALLDDKSDDPHEHGDVDYNTILEGSEIFAGIDTSKGIVQGFTTRHLSPSDIGALPAEGSYTMYVSTSGSDSTGNGSAGSPWASIAKASSEFKNHMSEITVNVGPGNYTSGSSIIIKHNYPVNIVGDIGTPTQITTNDNASGFIIETGIVRIYNLDVIGWIGGWSNANFEVWRGANLFVKGCKGSGTDRCFSLDNSDVEVDRDSSSPISGHDTYTSRSDCILMQNFSNFRSEFCTFTSTSYNVFYAWEHCRIYLSYCTLVNWNRPNRAIYCQRGANVHLDSCTFDGSNCSPDGQGSVAVGCSTGCMSILTCTFNNYDYPIYSESNGLAYVVNSTFDTCMGYGITASGGSKVVQFSNTFTNCANPTSPVTSTGSTPIYDSSLNLIVG